MRVPACFFSLLLFLSAGSALAQFDIGGAGNTIALRIKPEHPRAGEEVRVFLENYSFDLNRSEISWFVNGKLQAKGLGEKSITFITGGLGSASSIVVSIKNPDGDLFQKTLEVRPAHVDLLFEADSYTPPFYRGKALYPYQGLLRIIAIPSIIGKNGKKIDSKNLVFKWKKRDKAAAQASGPGKNVFLIQEETGLIHRADVDVEVSSLDQSIIATGSISLMPLSPQIALYENNPLYGILYGKALGQYVSLAGEEAKISAAPYFFSAAAKNDPGLTYLWSMNGEKSANLGNKSDAVFRAESGTSGVSLLGLKISSSASLMQEAENTVNLRWNVTAQDVSFK